VALTTYPAMLNSTQFPVDAKARAMRVLNGCGGRSIGNKIYQHIIRKYSRCTNVEHQSMEIITGYYGINLNASNSDYRQEDVQQAVRGTFYSQNILLNPPFVS
jgi:hypothetical protein